MTDKNRAQVKAPYTVDMFYTLPVDSLVTFTDSFPTFYKVVPDAHPESQLLIDKAIFNQHFKYYVQARLF